MRISAKILTLLVGAFPATYLSLIAGLGIYIGVLAVVDGEISGLVLVAWGGAGIYGTLSLWAVAFGFVRPWSVAGLVVGTIALLPIAGTLGIHELRYLILWSDPVEFLSTLSTTGPIVVAVSWLGVLVARSFRQPRSPSTGVVQA